MKIVVIGLGSMGKRRIRLLKKYIQSEEENCEKEWSIIGVDEDAERCQEVGKQYLINTYGDLLNALQFEKPDCAIISTSPLSHANLIQTCLKNKLHVFTELNLVSDLYDENMKLAEAQEVELFLSSTFLYRKEMDFLKKEVQKNKFQGGYRYHVGQYLPVWHPWESYQDFFVSNKKTNACREIFAIELPWLTAVFGEIRDIKVLHKKASKLSVDFDDMYYVILEHESGVLGNLSVEVISPKTVRELEVWNEEFYIEWKGSPETLKYYNQNSKKIEDIDLYTDVEHVEGYSSFVVENAYYDELVNFIECVEKKSAPKYSFEQDRKILEWIDRIEE